jgi:hypothetical protein
MSGLSPGIRRGHLVWRARDQPNIYFFHIHGELSLPCKVTPSELDHAGLVFRGRCMG